MTLNVLVFGIVKEITGKGQITVQFDAGLTVAQLKNELAIQYPQLGRLASFAIAVNGIYAADDTLIQQDDEVAVIPPVSGG